MIEIAEQFVNWLRGRHLWLGNPEEVYEIAKLLGIKENKNLGGGQYLKSLWSGICYKVRQFQKQDKRIMAGHIAAHAFLGGQNANRKQNWRAFWIKEETK